MKYWNEQKNKLRLYLLIWMFMQMQMESFLFCINVFVIPYWAVSKDDIKPTATKKKKIVEKKQFLFYCTKNHTTQSKQIWWKKKSYYHNTVVFHFICIENYARTYIFISNTTIRMLNFTCFFFFIFNASFSSKFVSFCCSEIGIDICFMYSAV